RAAQYPLPHRPPVSVPGQTPCGDLRQIRDDSTRGRAAAARRPYRGCMPRVPRQTLPPGLYHVTAHGIRSEPIFLDDLDRANLLHLLADADSERHFICRAFCLMTTHYHLLVETTSGDLSTRMKRVNGLHALRFNRAHGYSGHLFGRRFRATEI